MHFMNPAKRSGGGSILCLAIKIAVGLTCILAPSTMTFRASGPLVGNEGSTEKANSPVWAQGYGAGDNFENVAGTAVNTFNFNFVMAFSTGVGLSYPENAGVTLQATRYYNSQHQRWVFSGCHFREFYRIRRENPMGLGWDLNFGRIIEVVNSDRRSWCEIDGVYGFPYRTESVFSYVAPDGSRHTLQYDSATDDFRSHDGSYLRAKQQLDANDTLIGWVLEFPSGLVYEMDHWVPGPWKTDFSRHVPHVEDEVGCSVALPNYFDLHQGDTTLFIPDSQLESNYRDRDWVGYYTTRVYSKADTSVTPSSFTIEYHGPSFGEPGWDPVADYSYIPKRVRDQFDRTIDIIVDPATKLIQQIDVRAPQDAAGNPRIGSYNFTYETLTIPIPLTTDTHDVQLLTRVEGPEVNPGERYVHLYTYTSGGRLESIRYPSGKLEQYAYRGYSFLSREDRMRTAAGCQCLDPPGEVTSPGVGIQQKTVFLDGDPGNTSSANRLVWTFDQIPKLVGSEEFSCLIEDHPGHCDEDVPLYNQIHIMEDPAGNFTTKEFRTPNVEIDDYGAVEFGFRNASGHGDLLVERFYQGPVDYTSTDPSPEVVGDLVKEIVYEYESYNYDDFVPESSTSQTAVGCMNSIHRLVSSTTTTHYESAGDPTGVAVTVIAESSDYDGFGHYQESVVRGNGVGATQQGSRVDYAADNRDEGGVRCPQSAFLIDNWRLDVVLSEQRFTRTDGNSDESVDRTDYWYNSQTGLRNKSVARSDLASPYDPCDSNQNILGGDIVTRFEYTTKGDLEKRTVEEFGSQGTQYVTEYGYESGVLKSQCNTTGQGELGYCEFSRTIDPDSGLVVAEYSTPATAFDLSGSVISTKKYNVLGWLTEVQAGDDEPGTISYENVTDASGELRLGRVVYSRGSGDQKTEFVKHYDSAGRVVRLETLRPDDNPAYRHNQYDFAGRLAYTSVWTGLEAMPDPDQQGAPDPPPGTYFDYSYVGADCPNPLPAVPPESEAKCQDPFGRARKVTGPRGEISRARYFGTNRTVTIEDIAVAGIGNDFDSSTESASTTYWTDGIGRLRAVDSPSTGGGVLADSPVVDAIYEYDGGGRLVEVKLAEGLIEQRESGDQYVFGLTAPQVRAFSYDDLGHQESSTHPESGTVTTLDWDALGNPTRTQDARAAAMGYHHETTYDVAGRPTKLSRVLDDSQEATSIVYLPGDPDIEVWSSSSQAFASANSVACVGETAWYIGDGSCLYSQGLRQKTSLTTTTPISVPAGGAQLSFRYFRDLRESSLAAYDELRVLVLEDSPTPDWGSAEELYFSNCQRLSWSRWKRSPSFSLDAYKGKEILIQFYFSARQRNQTGVGKGLAISEIVIEHQNVEVLNEWEYDDTSGPASNKTRGKLTTSRSFDESTHQASFTRTLFYDQNEGRLSSEEVRFDWDRDGVFDEFETTYAYDDYGQLTSQSQPHLSSETTPRQVDYTYRHGALVGVNSEQQGSLDILPYSFSTPGIEYNLAGGMSLIRYGNGAVGYFETNEAFLPKSVKVDRAGVGSTLFDTGEYVYDGAGNISAIGSDVYRYDLAGRLRRARVASDTVTSGLYIDYNYDEFGNMESRRTGIAPDVYDDSGPYGLAFSGRSHTDNRVDSVLTPEERPYDENGNLLADPPPVPGLPGHRYEFSPESRLSLVREAVGGKIYQESHYDSSGNRWARMIDADGGEALLILRDASGQVAVEYVETNDGLGPQVSQHYIRGNGKILARLSKCGPAPEIKVVSVSATSVTLEKIDHVPEWDDYTYSIETESGAVTENWIYLPNDQFSIDRSEFSSIENSWIRLRTEAQCGPTGYSNAISFNQIASPSSCVEAIALGNRDFVDGSSPYATLQLKAYATCSGSYTYKALYHPSGPGGPAMTLASDLAIPELDLTSTGLSSGFGYYSFVEYDPGIGVQGDSSSLAIKDGRSSANASGGLPGRSAFKTEYVHWDHLGSTRLVTNELGVEASHTKFYPFGHEADASNEWNYMRMKFTGHERDRELGLDYMFARYYGPNLGRFVSVDPGDDVALGLPQSWNKYAYVRNNPTLYNDPNGTCVWDLCAAEGAALGALVVATAAMLASPNPADPDMTNGEVLVEGAKTAFETGKNLVNNLFSKSSTGDSDGNSGEQSSGEESKRHTPDQQAVVELAKEAGAKGGVSEDEAGTLVDMATDSGLPARGPESHPDRKSEISRNKHIHIDKQDHIPVKE